VNITYVEGDLFEGIKTAPKPLLIAHVCNDAGKWGKGFVLPLGRHFPVAKKCYLAKWDHGVSRGCQRVKVLGEVQILLVSAGIYVANMVAQQGVGGPHPLRYSSLVTCLDEVRVRYGGIYAHGGIHAPMFGAGLGGGNWRFIEVLIQEIWCDAGIPVTIYQLVGQLKKGKGGSDEQADGGDAGRNTRTD